MLIRYVMSGWYVKENPKFYEQKAGLQSLTCEGTCCC